MRTSAWWIKASAGSTVACVVLTLAGCSGASHDDTSAETKGIGELSGAELVSQAVDASANASSFRIRTDTATERTQILTDLHRTADGTCYGPMKLGSRSFTVIFAGKYAYVRASAAYWHEFNRQLRGDDFGERMAQSPSKWGRVETVDYRQFCDVREAAASMGLVPQRLDDARVGAKHFGPDRRTVVDVTTSDGGPTATVDADAPHYLVDMRFGGTHVTLGELGEPAEVEIPVEGEYLAYDRLIVAL